MKNVKMQRFLASIGIENSERYDMDFVAVKRIIGSGSIQMIIRKDTPWDNDLLEEFKEHLAFIDYEYTLSFEYASAPSFEDVDSLFQNWFFTSYHTLPFFQLMPGEGKTIFAVAPEEGGASFQAIVDDFSSYLKFLCYPFKLEITKEAIPSEIENKVEKKEETKDVQEIKETPLPEENNEPVYENSSSSDEEDEDNDDYEPPEPDANDGDEQERLEDLRKAEQEYLDSIKAENEAREHKKIYVKGDYVKLDSIKDVYSTNASNVEIEGEIFGIDEKNPIRKTRKVL